MRLEVSDGKILSGKVSGAGLFFMGLWLIKKTLSLIFQSFTNSGN